MCVKALLMFVPASNTPKKSKLQTVHVISYEQQENLLGFSNRLTFGLEQSAKSSQTHVESKVSPLLVEAENLCKVDGAFFSTHFICTEDFCTRYWGRCLASFRKVSAGATSRATRYYTKTKF